VSYSGGLGPVRGREASCTPGLKLPPGSAADKGNFEDIVTVCVPDRSFLLFESKLKVIRHESDSLPDVNEKLSCVDGKRVPEFSAPQ
jgi:hypothetical protein